MIEFAQMEPPFHEMTPMRVLLKIQKSDPPRLDHPARWSKDFNDFLKLCLVKDPHKRPNIEELLKHPFVKHAVDKKPVLDLLAEFKAEIINEEEMDLDDEERGTDGTDEPSEVDTLSTSSSMLDTSHDSSYESRKISSISVHETMQTPTHRNSFVASSTPVQLKSKLSSTISPISEERLESERSDQKPRKGPAPPPPQYSPPPQKRQRSVSDIVPNTTRVNGEVFSADHDEDEPVTPVRNIANELKNDVHHEETVESESGDTLVDDSDDDDDLSPEKERVLQMLDSVIQEQEESFTGAVSDTEETEEQRLDTPEVTDQQ